MGTGGGPGADENFCVWQERDLTLLVKYTPQYANLYVTVIYIWDKAKSFLLTKPKGPLPPGAAIRDGVATASKSGQGKLGPYKSTPPDDNLMQSLNAITKGRKETGDLLKTFMEENKEPKSLTIDRIIEAIKNTEAMIEAQRNECFRLHAEKEAIKQGEGSKADKKSKARPIKLKLTEGDDNLQRLRFTLKIQQEELDDFTGYVGKKGDDDDDGFSSGYEST